MGGRGTTRGFSATEVRVRRSEVDYTQTKISGAAGSNEGGVYRGSDGIERYVKFYKNPTQAFSEALANNIYQDLGIDAPKSAVFTDSKGRTAFASEIIKGISPVSPGTVSKSVASEFLRGYAADVLTVNWDVVGLVNDNIVTKGGKVYRIDNGASFLHRAQGTRKPSSVITELQEFTSFTTSTQYARIFKGAGITSPKQITGISNQIARIRQLRDSSGGWDKYVRNKFPTWSGTDRDAIVRLLTNRTRNLLNLKF